MADRNVSLSDDDRAAVISALSGSIASAERAAKSASDVAVAEAHRGVAAKLQLLKSKFTLTK